jgi:hypothetical protein
MSADDARDDHRDEDDEPPHYNLMIGYLIDVT